MNGLSLKVISMASTELMIEFRMRMQSQMIRVYCSSDREKLLKFEAEGREFAKLLRSLEQFIQTVKGQNVFLNWFLEVSHI